MKNAQHIIKVLYEDELMVAVAKPPGIDASRSGSGNSDGMAEILRNLRGDAKLEPANRLTRFESGILVLGKNPSIIAHLRKGLKSRVISQVYTALVLGQTNRKKITIESAHGSSRGTTRRQANAQPRARNQKKSRTATSRELPTTITVLKSGSRQSLLRCVTNVETTHALRAQLRAAKLRLVGDNIRNPAKRAQHSNMLHLHLGRLSFHHPTRKAKIHIQCPLPRSWNSPADTLFDLEGRLEAALIRRLPCMAKDRSNAFRMFSGQFEGIEGLIAEQYSNVAVLQIRDEDAVPPGCVKRAAKWYCQNTRAKSVYVKRFVKDRSRTSDESAASLRSPVPEFGEASEQRIAVEEHGSKYWIRPYDGYSVGLFLDQRENRSFVRRIAGKRDVLNLFSYTCGFSVAAALGGARSTVSVDLSPKHLQWGRENFDLNGLDLTDHEFVCDESHTYLKRSGRRGRFFDLIIIDPPTFAHARRSKRSFSVTRDFADLIAAASSVLSSGGTMMIASNHRRLQRKDLLLNAKKGAKRRRFQVVESPRIPEDFKQDRDCAKTLFLRFD